MKKLVIIISVLCIAGCSSFKSNNFSGKSTDKDIIPSKRMLDGRIWTTSNLQVVVPGSYCIDSASCAQFGRLYTWRAAKTACSLIGEGWRLPTNEEWALLIKEYGGFYNDSVYNGKAAYLTLIEGGNAGFNALLAGNREANGNYERYGAHGFYWTATEEDSSQAWFINFANAAPLINRHIGDKERAVSVRCILN